MIRLQKTETSIWLALSHSDAVNCHPVRCSMKRPKQQGIKGDFWPAADEGVRPEFNSL